MSEMRRRQEIEEAAAKAAGRPASGPKPGPKKKPWSKKKQFLAPAPHVLGIDARVEREDPVNLEMYDQTDFDFWADVLAQSPQEAQAIHRP